MLANHSFCTTYLSGVVTYLVGGYHALVDALAAHPTSRAGSWTEADKTA